MPTIDIWEIYIWVRERSIMYLVLGACSFGICIKQCHYLADFNTVIMFNVVGWEAKDLQPTWCFRTLEQSSTPIWSCFFRWCNRLRWNPLMDSCSSCAAVLSVVVVGVLYPSTHDKAFHFLRHSYIQNRWDLEDRLPGSRSSDLALADLVGLALLWESFSAPLIHFFLAFLLFCSRMIS